MRLSSNLALLQVIGTLIATTNASETTSKQLRGNAASLDERRLPGTTIDCVNTLVADVQFADHQHDESYIACEQADGTTYTVDVSDEEVKQHKNAIAAGLVELGPLPDDAEILPNGKIKTNGKFAFQSKEKKKGPWGKNDRRLAILEGDKTVLVVRVEASDGATSYTEAQLSDSVFGTDTDPVNLKSQYEACSHDKLIINPAPDRTSTNGGAAIVNGATTVTVTTSTSETDSAMRPAITAALNAQFGVSSPTQLADHVMYCLPPATMSGIAYAYINSWNSVYSNQWCTYVSAQMHEIGHNLNFAHSNEAGTYNDQSGMMGYSYGQSDSPKMCWNGPKSWQSGWYSERHATFEYIQGVAVDYTLIGQVDIPNSSSGDVIIKVNQQTSTDFYVAFNRKVGSNSGTVEGGNQVMVWRAGGEGSGYAESELLAKLNAGNTYTITDFDGTGNDLDVVVNSIDLSASPVAVASITIGTGTAQPSKSPTPVPSASPTVSAAPSKAPTPFPTKAPTPPPTQFPTRSPVPCTLAKIDQSCTTGDDCCSGFCTGGNPRNRVCYSNTPTTPAPVAPSTPAPVAPPTTQPPVTSPPVGSCSPWKGQCSNNSDCCSNNCKNNGRCS